MDRTTLSIYDSRNYQVLIDKDIYLCAAAIYDSRNYQVLIDIIELIAKVWESTIVEIIKSL